MGAFADHLATSITPQALARDIAHFCNDHCEFPSPSAAERICDLKSFVTVQPGYAWIDKRFLHGYERYLSTYQIASQVPLARFARADVPLHGSSDSPVTNREPARHHHRHRAHRDGHQPTCPLAPDRRLGSDRF